MNVPAPSALRPAARASAVVFTANGALMASWVARIPAAKAHLGASAGGLGTALLCAGIGSVVAMPFSGRLVSRHGSRPVIAVCAVVGAVAYSCLGLVGSLVALGAVLFVIGACVGVWDVAMNVQAHHVEVATGRPIMPLFHAGWSAGGIVGAGLGALAAYVGLGIGTHLTAASVVALVAVFAALRFYLPDAGDADAEQSHGGGMRLLRDRRVLLVGAMGLAAACAEGAASDWSALMVVNVHQATQAQGAIGFGVFAAAMALGRAGGTWAVERFGRVGVLRWGGVLAAVGVVVAVASPVLGLSYLGILLWGLGLSGGFPLAMSAAGETPGRGPEAIAVVSVLAYGGFLIGPPLIGHLADVTGLGRALWVVVALGATMAVTAGAARTPAVARSVAQEA
ncbi:MAG: MFS transporter [Motilibacteraceae bacterium]